MAAPSCSGSGRVMVQSLAAFQSNLGRALLGEDTCPIDPQSPGFRFTMTVRRSWCEGRSVMAARAVLRLMPNADRQRLVSEYVDHGGGLAWFQATESERFLAFLAVKLPDPSHALTICRMTQALAQARLGSSIALPLVKQVGGGPIDRGRHAALVWFYADPGEVIAALNGDQLPPIGPPSHAVLFAPGINGLFRVATEDEAALWATLAVADAPPALVSALLMEGVLAHPA
jgi:hypothetical protein